MSLLITGVTNIGQTGFRVTFDQNSPPAGFEDRVYYSDQTIEAEADGTLFATITQAATFVDLIGLPSGEHVFVAIFRYVNSVYDSVAYAEASTYPAELVPASAEWTENWSGRIWERWYQKYAYHYHFKRMTDGELGNFVRLSNLDANWVSVFLLKTGIPQNVPLTIEATIRYSGYAQGQSAENYYAFTLYNGEPRYIGAYADLGGLHRWQMIGSYAGNWSYDGAFSPGTFHYKFVYDPITGAHEYWINGTKITSSYPQAPYEWRGLLNLWITNWFNAAGLYVDIGEIKVTSSSPDKNRLVVGGYDRIPWDTWAPGNFLVWGGTENVFAGVGGVTAKLQAGYVYYYDCYSNMHDENWDPVWTPWTVGDFGLNTPVINLPANKRWSRLRLRGKQISGYMRIRVLDGNDALISDSEIPGNSTGFFPHQVPAIQEPPGGPFTEPDTIVSLDGVTASAIKLEIAGYYDGTEVRTGTLEQTYNPTPSMLKGFIVEIEGIATTIEPAAAWGVFSAANPTVAISSLVVAPPAATYVYHSVAPSIPNAPVTLTPDPAFMLLWSVDPNVESDAIAVPYWGARNDMAGLSRLANSWAAMYWPPADPGIVVPQVAWCLFSAKDPTVLSGFLFNYWVTRNEMAGLSRIGGRYAPMWWPTYNPGKPIRKMIAKTRTPHYVPN